MQNTATVGVFVRTRPETQDEVQDRLEALEGAHTFPLEDPGTLGLVLQASDLNAAHHRLRTEVETTAGVLCAFPIQMHFGPPTPESD